MEWYAYLGLGFTLLLILLLLDLPIAVAFLLINVLGLYFIMGGASAISMLGSSMLSTLSSFSLLAIPLFIFMGELLFHSGIARQLLIAVDKWMGVVRARLCIVAVLGSALLGMLSGSSIGATATMGATLAKDMHERGYRSELIAGPIIGAGGLAMIIPPSSIAILLAFVGNLSVDKVLIAGIMPGFLMALCYVAMLTVRVAVSPALVPHDIVQRASWIERLKTLRLVFPVALLIFMVLGLIFLGIATASESAAFGALGALIVGGFYGNLSVSKLMLAARETIKITSALFLIIAGSAAFSQILSFVGATRGFVSLVSEFDIAPMLVVGAMMVTILLLGMFVEAISIIMITIPIYMPIILELGLNPIWFAVLMLINLHIAGETPPVGMHIFAAQGFMPWIKYHEIIRGVIPFILIDVAVIILLMLFPDIVLWLPDLALGS